MLTRRVLVVDPDPGSRSALEALLARAGFRVLAVANGEQALLACAGEVPALVLSEVLLEEMSGYELLREIRDRHGDKTGFVFVTGHRTEAVDRAGGILMGADDYVVKPFDDDELLARARRNARETTVAVPHHRGHSLTAREAEVLALLADGMSQTQIAAQLVISPRTVSTHIQRVLAKLGVNSRAQAVALAHQEGLVRVAA